MAPNPCQIILGALFEYDTPRILHIKSKKVGVVNRLIQLLIIGYVIGFAIVYKKGYQEFDNVQSAVTSKVKGVVYSNLSAIPGVGERIWDVADYVVPPMENDAFFVITNVLRTLDQKQDKCGEHPSIALANCTSDADCKANTPSIGGNGVRTGRCVNLTIDVKAQMETFQTCEIHAWCPVENSYQEKPPGPVLEGSKAFTVFIKNNIEFPLFKVKRRNLPNNGNDSYLQNCRYSKLDTECPIFELETIIKEAGEDYNSMADQGGVIQIVIKWDCNLDYNVENCRPAYDFRRLDSADYSIAKGFNFRYANHYAENGTAMRTLTKAYGIRYIITVTGSAGKFNGVPLLLNVGSGLALLSVATIICDIFALYMLKARYYYREQKYHVVTGDDAYQQFENSESRPDGIQKRKRAGSGDYSNIAR